MRITTIIISLIMAMLTISVGQAAAFTVTPTAATVVPGQPVFFTIDTTPGACTLSVNFGDGVTATTGPGTCSGLASLSCSTSISHAFSSPGSYTINATVVNCTNGAFPPTRTGSASVTVTGDTALLNIKRQELSFPANGRGEITVKRNHAGLKARADLWYTGAGLLKGYWEVDGRLLQRIDQMVLPGGHLMLETLALPPIPTFDEGVHTLRLIIESPLASTEYPVLVYYVTAEESSEQLAPLRLLSPHDGSIDPFAPLLLEWEPTAKASVYYLVFSSRDSSAPLFSAYVKEPRYTLPLKVLESYFAPGYSYSWQVVAYQDEKRPLATSPSWQLTFGRRDK